MFVQPTIQDDLQAKELAKKSGLRRRWTCELVSSRREHGFLRKPDDNK